MAKSTARIDGRTGELTGSQVITKQSYMKGKALIDNAKLRRMRKDPVIALCRYMFFAGILSGEWSFEGEDEDRVEFIKEVLMPMRRHILSSGSLGCFDFGWQPYEKVFDIRSDSSTVLKKLKPLLQDTTELITDDRTGAFLGLKAGSGLYSATGSATNWELPLEKCLLLNFDVEGTDWKGNSTLENAEGPYDAGMALGSSAQRFDEKMAGAHWVIRYPDGKTMFNGERTWNYEIADAILQSLESSGMVAIPISQESMMGDHFDPDLGWDIKLITASGASFPFADRFDYLDKSKARALGFPERTLLEGAHGTLAEAGAHQDFLITLLEYRHESLVELINWHLINQLLRLNYGDDAENTVVLVANPINDVDRAALSAVYDKIISSPDGLIMELDKLDIDAMAEGLGLPRVMGDEADDEATSSEIREMMKLLEVQPLPLPAPDETPLPAPDETPKPETPLQSTALNGAQISSLLEVVSLVVAGDLPKDSAAGVISAAFPLLTSGQINAILSPLEQKDELNAPVTIPEDIPPTKPTEPVEPEDEDVE